VALGPGLLESVYETALAFELSSRGVRFEQQKVIPVVYRRIEMEGGFRADLIVEAKVIVEVKSIELVTPVHKKILLTYLKLSGIHVGLLLNFRVMLMKQGITRIVNDL
jgi:GxxExxY protein